MPTHVVQGSAPMYYMGGIPMYYMGADSCSTEREEGGRAHEGVFVVLKQDDEIFDTIVNSAF